MDEQTLNPDKETKISFNHTRFSIDSNFKLPTFDWLQNVPGGKSSSNFIEVRFKNTRKGIYNNVNLLRLKKGDVVAVEASPGHDIGIISLAGEIVNEQLRKLNLDPAKNEFKKVYRLAKDVDIEKWKEGQGLENPTMLKARKIAADLNLNMKIGDVEYQGDRTKAIFYYIAEERVDFRELIKVLADQFKVRIEMRQIGARQEAGRIGGIGSCGRELCCSTWMTNFVSVSTNAARHQELSLNPQKLAGQCGKLKCCLNYELDIYIEAQKGFPSSEIYLETNDGTIYHKKTDIFKRIMWYSFDKKSSLNQFPVSVDRVFKI
ncbi:MAG: regulatory iron-sulfur-containing complex subunit RicT, partial [Bacteroidota bacterium]|nr:regulatory iron-sulfur-containing complex subunit RicT [Bacteroidota bacterium]